MAPFCLLVVSLVLVFHGVVGTDLRESFYNELRNLLLNGPILEVEGNVPARPVEVVGWGSGLRLGQVTGVSVNPLGQPVVFHRGPRVWDNKSFNISHHYQKIHEGPIKVDTVITLDPETGDILSSWGAGLFYLPHGITIDHRGNTWLTDVAMHQVMKFPPGWKSPSLRLGEFMKPGHGLSNLCKPTSVAIASTKEIYVADGYCNNRILKYNHVGVLKRTFPRYGEFLSLVVPHSLSLIEERDLLCIADRENMRVVCIKAEIGQSLPSARLTTLTIHQPDLGRVFGIATRGNLVYAVNGPTSSHIPVQGFTLDPFSEAIIDHWTPFQKDGFADPHDIAISPKGDALYVTEIGPNKVWKFTFTSAIK